MILLLKITSSGHPEEFFYLAPVPCHFLIIVGICLCKYSLTFCNFKMLETHLVSFLPSLRIGCFLPASLVLLVENGLETKIYALDVLLVTFISYLTEYLVHNRFSLNTD